MSKRFIEWVPRIVKHRPYDTIPMGTGQPVIGCHGCDGCFRVGKTTQYPQIGKGGYQPREVCDSCLEHDRESGVFDAIMDIWDNYEEGV